ncbi:MAG: SH3 domain-containing protein [Eubacteriales bacterium]|nr:SH3 domain-containing protein [Eubacteriales bacterium]
MKKTCLAILMLVFVLSMAGCGFEQSAEAIVTVVRETPTPVPTATPIPTPTPEAVATPVPEVVTETTPSGAVVTVQSGTYTLTSDVNLRSDCSTDATPLVGIPNGTVLTSTGVCENGWLRVEYNGQVGYITNEFATAS